MMATYKERGDFMAEKLNKIPGITCLRGDGAFYVFPNITKTGMTSEQFADFALEKAKIALLPGTNFGEYGKGYVRLAFPNSLENIKEGLKRLELALKNNIKNK